jgi:general secretion pathway protein H
MRATRGFTLVELLVVLVILGSLVGLAVLSTGIAGPSRELKNEAERLAGLISLLAEEAVLDNQEYGLYLQPGGYQVLRFDEGTGRWQPQGKQPHRLPEWAVLSYELDGEPLQLASTASSASSADDQDEKDPDDEAHSQGPQPQLLVLSNGELSPFRLRLAEKRKDGQAQVMSSDGFQLPRADAEQP